MNHILKLASVGLAAICTLCACGTKTNPVIKPPVINNGGGGGGDDTKPDKDNLSAWQKGQLDIHFISTGRGECAFFIFPDGTQMIVDAGASIQPQNESTNLGYPASGIAPKPNASQVAGFWYLQYIKKCMSWTGNDKIDFAVSTHFDGDHLGVGYANYGITPPTSPYGKWYQTGFTYLMDNLKFGLFLDHGYPDYSYPYPQSGTVKTNCDNYRACADYHQKNSGMKRELFKAGSNTQIACVRDAASYPGFKVQNVFVNGVCWNGNGTDTYDLFPKQSEFIGSGGAKEKSPCENSCSCIFKLSYGKFDYYGGGDAGYNGASSFSWKHVEKAAAKVVGKVEVMKGVHHGSADGCSAELIAGLAPQDIIFCVWQAVQPRATTLNRICSESSVRLYSTAQNADYCKNEYTVNGSRFLANHGHIVVRVTNGGDQYTIYQLDDTDTTMSMKIEKSFGPYKCY